MLIDKTCFGRRYNKLCMFLTHWCQSFNLLANSFPKETFSPMPSNKATIWMLSCSSLPSAWCVCRGWNNWWSGCVSKLQLRNQDALAEGGLLIAVSWSPELRPELRPVHASLPGSAAASVCFRLLQNQPQHRHLRPLTIHTSLFSRPPSPSLHLSSGLQRSLPSLLPHLTPHLPRVILSAVCLINVSDRRKGVSRACDGFGKGRPAAGAGSRLLPDTQSPPDVWLRASCSRDPASWWTDEMLKHVVLWNVRGILQKHSHSRSSQTLAATQIQSLYLMGLFKKKNKNCKYNAKNNNPSRRFTAPLKPEEGQELERRCEEADPSNVFYPAGAFERLHAEAKVLKSDRWLWEVRIGWKQK